MQGEIIGDSSKELMSLAQVLAEEARTLCMFIDHTKDEVEKLRLIKQAVELLDDAARIRRQAIDMQLEEIRQAQKRIEARLPEHLRLF